MQYPQRKEKAPVDGRLIVPPHIEDQIRHLVHILLLPLLLLARPPPPLPEIRDPLFEESHAGGLVEGLGGEDGPAQDEGEEGEDGARGAGCVAAERVPGDGVAGDGDGAAGEGVGFCEGAGDATEKGGAGGWGWHCGGDVFEWWFSYVV